MCVVEEVFWIFGYMICVVCVVFLWVIVDEIEVGGDVIMVMGIKEIGLFVVCLEGE